MNNKGNILIVGIVLLNVICILGNIFTTNLRQIYILNHIDTNMETVKIKTIQKIENEFKNECKDFEINENEIHVFAEYDVIDYLVTFEGKNNYQMKISYDYVFECIENIEYIYD